MPIHIGRQEGRLSASIRGSPDGALSSGSRIGHRFLRDNGACHKWSPSVICCKRSPTVTATRYSIRAGATSAGRRTLVDLVQVLSALGSVALILGIAIALVQLRGLRRQHQEEMVIRGYAPFVEDAQLTRAYWLIQAWNYDNFAAFETRASIDEWTAMDQVATHFEMMGVLYKRGHAKLDLLDDLFAGSLLLTWRKLRPLIEGYRVHAAVPDYAQWFEYLARALDTRLTARGEIHPSIDERGVARPSG